MDLIDREQLMNYIRSKKINIGKLAHDIIMKQKSVNAVSEEVYTREYNLRKDAEMKAYKLKKALDQKPRWIPVSERLPNLDDYTGSRVWQKKVLITGYLSFDDTKELFISEAFAKDVIYNRVHNTVIEAWMPLPALYKVESEETK